MIKPKTQHFMAQRMGAFIRPHPSTTARCAPEIVTNVILEAARDALAK